MIAVIVQCRLSSTRLPEKALLKIDGKSLLEFTLCAMKKAKADMYWVACDYDSYDALFPIAEKCDWKIFAGPLDDVLKRFCMLQEKIHADVIVRATADNPFLFYEVANESIRVFFEKRKIANIDYFTFQGLPHGSGVEVFDAASLLRAEKSTDNLYDREHVGPAFYNHRESFSCVFEKADRRFYFPELRTTVDTKEDFRRAEMIYRFLERERKSPPFSADDIIRACRQKKVARPVLYVPTVLRGRGTGHIRRALSFAKSGDAFLYIDKKNCSPECMLLLKEALGRDIYDWQVLYERPEKNEFHLIVSDWFSLEKKTARFFSENAELFLSLDEGSRFGNFSDYLLDVIPGNLFRRANYAESHFLEIPKNKKMQPMEKKSEIKKVLVSFGGEDPASLTLPVSRAFCSLGFAVTAVINDGKIADTLASFGCRTFSKIENLKEHLYEYDMLATHYGFTAYEAKSAGLAILLFATTRLHYALSKKYGFAVLKKHEISAKKIKKILQNERNVFCNFQNTQNGSKKKLSAEKKSLKDFIFDFAFSAKKIPCPVCQHKNTGSDEVVFRTVNATYRKCASCAIVYMSVKKDAHKMTYEKDYFFSDYKKQYGKTYLEDFSAIQNSGRARLKTIDAIRSSKGFLLDIGCAYGPFLKAASDDGWRVFGCDISQDAISYVKRELRFPALSSSIFDFASERDFGIRHFDCVTMWFVIEHFENVKSVLEKVSSLLRCGGVFAFSTPSLDGVSASRRREKFFLQSPSDHFTIWSRKSAKKILRQFGFKIEKIISTGHHPERFPFYEKHKNPFWYTVLLVFSKIKRMGDTFEIYCRKIK